MGFSAEALVIDGKRLRAGLARLMAAVVLVGRIAQAGDVNDDRVTLQDAIARPLHALTLEDVVQQRHISEPRLSPDGRKLAFLVTQAFLDCNCRYTALYASSMISGEAPVKLLESPRLADLQWNPRGNAITVLTVVGASQQLASVDLASREVRRSLESAADTSTQARFFDSQSISGYWWSPDGRHIAIVRDRTADDAQRSQMIRDGVVYDDALMWGPDIVSQDWARARGQARLSIYDADTGVERTVWTNSGSFLPEVRDIKWAEDGQRIAFVERRGHTFDESIKVMDVASGSVSAVDSPGGIQSNLTWLTAASGLAFVSTSSAGVTKITSNAARGRPVAVGTGLHVSGDWTDVDDGSLYVLSNQVNFHRVNQGIYVVVLKGGASRRLTPLSVKVSDCDRVRQAHVVCIVQSPAESERIASIDLKTGAWEILAEVAAGISSSPLNPVQEKVWRNRFGEETSGYLMLPSARRPAAGFPLIVLAYGFDGDFVSRASRVHTSYPAQSWVNEGFAVLLLNYPPMRHENDSPQQTRHQLGESPLASLSAIVTLLSGEGVVDRRHVGYAGHSFGGFLAAYALEHSTLIAAAEINNGGTNVEPSSFLGIGNEAARADVRLQMGGPPWGSSLKNYERLSASLNAAHTNTPVLMEYDAFEANSAVDMYSAFRGAGVPTEFVIYPDDGHSFMLPSHQLLSMQRNLDWFRFWLKGEEDENSEKIEQYRRWRELRAQFERRAK